MIYILLLPELVIYWAWRQHNSACNFTKKHQANTGWTRVHSFFLIMGGFTLHKEGRPVRVLEAKELEELSEAGKIEWPTITEEEISDRSKGDYLSKTIVLFQTTWFVGQCIARGAYGLDVTELEVVTLAFATLTGVIYYFWWDKPLDVRCSIPVQLLEDDVEKQDTPPPAISDQEIQEGDENLVLPPDPLPSGDTSTPTPDPPFTQMQRFVALLLFPLKRFLRTFDDTMNRETLEGNTVLRVPTFYSPPNSSDDKFIADIFAVCVSIVFGATHCVAWSFHFATLQERWAWRVSALFVLGLPTPYWVLTLLSEAISESKNKTIWMKLYRYLIGYLALAMMFLYVIARIVLLVLPLMALRALPPGAYVEVNWISFLPHI